MKNFKNNATKNLRGFSPQTNYTDRATAPMSEKSLQTFADKGYRVVSATDPQGRLNFLDPALLLFHTSRSSVILKRLSGPFLDPLLLRKSGSAEIRTQDLWICSQEL
jgi:hypothetical protein